MPLSVLNELLSLSKRLT